jgi:tripartite-type tricarboxylate transporter receptor subunit TctC
MRLIGRLLLAVLIYPVAAPELRAQTPAEFYKGRNLSLIIPNAPGGSFDLYARLVAAHRQGIPAPSIIPQTCRARAGCRS